MSFDPLDPPDPYDDRIRGPAGPPPPQSVVPAYRDPLHDPYAGDPNRGAARTRVWDQSALARDARRKEHQQP